jgi:MEMO1 family protein
MLLGRQDVRTPAVAGAFYPAHPAQLKTAVERFLVRTLEPVPALAVIVPHAGYIYSGATAGKTYASVELPERLIILCPNHTGYGEPLSLMASGAWSTPLGDVPVDTALAEALLAEVPRLADDALAHRREHAVEVQLPFLQVLLEHFSFVPLALGTHDYGALETLGRGMARAIAASKERVAIVVSSDMNHYEDARTNRAKDDLALESVTKLAPKELHRVVLTRHISMCGFAPAVAALVAAGDLGADRSEIVDYTHSGLVTGDDDEVVSYAGVRIYRSMPEGACDGAFGGFQHA